MKTCHRTPGISPIAPPIEPPMPSTSINNADKQLLEKSSKEYKVPIYYYGDNSMKLGRLFNRPYRISAVALKGVSEQDVNTLLETQ